MRFLDLDDITYALNTKWGSFEVKVFLALVFIILGSYFMGKIAKVLDQRGIITPAFWLIPFILANLILFGTSKSYPLTSLAIGGFVSLSFNTVAENLYNLPHITGIYSWDDAKYHVISALSILFHITLVVVNS